MKKSFRDPVTNVLKAHGFMELNASGDLAREELDDFNLEPGNWQLVGDAWQPYAGGVKAQKLAQINTECDKRIETAVLSYPDTEVLTFPKQETEARAHLADPASPTPMIDALAANRGIDKAELVSRIIAKADNFADYTGKIIGHRQRLEDQLNAATTNEEVAVVDPYSGWPEVTLPA